MNLLISFFLVNFGINISKNEWRSFMKLRLTKADLAGSRGPGYSKSLPGKYNLEQSALLLKIRLNMNIHMFCLWSIEILVHG